MIRATKIQISSREDFHNEAKKSKENFVLLHWHIIVKTRDCTFELSKIDNI